MKYDFKNLNFETLDANQSMAPEIFINQTGVTFSKRAAELLGFPAFVLCQLDTKNKVFAVRMCRSDERRGFKFCKVKGEQRGMVSITNKNLLEPIRKTMEGVWQKDKRYKVQGFWVADEKTLCFDLSEGVQEAYRRRGGRSSCAE